MLPLSPLRDSEANHRAMCLRRIMERDEISLRRSYSVSRRFGQVQANQTTPSVIAISITP